MIKYEIGEGGGTRKIIEAENMEAAMGHARDWVAGGSGDNHVMVTVWVAELGADGEYTGAGVWSRGVVRDEKQ